MLQSPFHSVGLAVTYGIGEAPYTSSPYPASPILPFVLVVVVLIQALGNLSSPDIPCNGGCQLCVYAWGRQVLSGIPDFGQEKNVDITHPGCDARASSIG